MSNSNTNIELTNRLLNVVNILENNIEVKGAYCGNLYGVIAILKDTIDLVQKETQQPKCVELSDAPQE